jgi:hypothetical protein
MWHGSSSGGGAPPAGRPGPAGAGGPRPAGRPAAAWGERRGRTAIVPSLTGVAGAPAPGWQHCVDVVRGATKSVDGSLLLAGHSGAGPLLPVIAAALRPPVRGLVFIDAFLPPTVGEMPLAPAGFMTRLRDLARDGVLPPWSEWFGADTFRELVPDAELRATLEREMPRLPLHYFDASVPVPEGWDRRACAYLLLSADVYGDSAAAARDRSWAVSELHGEHHLAPVTSPLAVATALLELERDL